MQSWGTRSHFGSRDTATEPTKSGVVGLLGAALGVPRGDTAAIAKLAALPMGVRADREGILEEDFHTVQNVPDTAGKNHRGVVTRRYYLAGALFLVAISGPAEDLHGLHTALQRPRWPLFLGRRAFPPARPVVAPLDNTRWPPLTDLPVEDALRWHPWLETDPAERRHAADGEARLLRAVIDTDPAHPEAEVRNDHPLSFEQANRRHRTRTIRTFHIPLTSQLLAHGAPDTERDTPHAEGDPA
jgi:CRISPR system Cascade subunit CasD